MASDEHMALSDDELLAAYRSSKDNRLLGTLLQRYTLLLYGVGMKYLKDSTKAGDAVQQVFLKALTHIPNQQIDNFKGWLYIMMRNHCLQLLRDKSHVVGDEVLSNIAAPDTRTGQQDALQKEHTLEQMNEALAELSAEQRECVSLFYLKKLSYQQIMEQTGYTFMQVKSHIQNGKRNLKTILLKKMGNERDKQ